MALGGSLPEEMLAPFLGLARAARAGGGLPDAPLADLYQTASPSRARRMLEHIAEMGLIVVRVDMMGKRSVSLPHLGWTTRPRASRATPPAGRAPRRRLAPACVETIAARAENFMLPRLEQKRKTGR